MRRNFILYVLALATRPLLADPVPGQVNTFQDGTAANWGAPPASPTVIPNGGPAGLNDQYLQVTSTGLSGPDSRMIVLNRSAQWSGNYIAPGLLAIDMDLKIFTSPGNQPLPMRLAFRNHPSSTGYIATTPFLLPADGQWHHAQFVLQAGNFTNVGGEAAFATFLANMPELRILSTETTASLNGDRIAAQIGIDNIRALPVPEPGWLLLLAWVGYRVRSRG